MRVSSEGVSDTTIDAARVHLDLLRRAGPVRRLRAGLDLSRSAIELSREGLRRRRPGLSETELLIEWVELQYGNALAAGVRRRMGLSP